MTKWVNYPETMKYFVLDEEVLLNRFNKVVKDGYGDNLPDWQLERIKIDATLIAYALGRKDRVIVTREVSSPAKKGANRKIPDVCKDVEVDCINDFELYRRLDFRID